ARTPTAAATRTTPTSGSPSAGGPPAGRATRCSSSSASTPAGCATACAWAAAPAPRRGASGPTPASTPSCCSASCATAAPRRRAGGPAAGPGFSAADFRRATYLGDDWCRRARGLLDLKRQLILQGVPGTGKTHVARCLARLLTGGREDAVRLVQFHPAYSYEEFVEGIKVRSVAVDGRHDVTYPVEDGLLCAFAARAARSPAQNFVLVIDEINRGNLPRIFGELLYLLEYRDQGVGLPYSRRDFRLPGNLYLLATMT